MQYSLCHLFVAPYPNKKLQTNPQIVFPEKSVEGLGLIWGKKYPFLGQKEFFQKKLSLVIVPNHSSVFFKRFQEQKYIFFQPNCQKPT